jgi:hypothetical protein
MGGVDVVGEGRLSGGRGGWRVFRVSKVAASRGAIVSEELRILIAPRTSPSSSLTDARLAIASGFSEGFAFAMSRDLRSLVDGFGSISIDVLIALLDSVEYDSI